MSKSQLHLRQSATVHMCQIKPVILQKLTQKRKNLLHHISIGRFFNNASGKIGKQLFQNSLQRMGRLDDKWLDRKWTNDLIRVMLNKTYFFFNKWPDPWIILPHCLIAIDICVSYDQIILLKSCMCWTNKEWEIKLAT